MELLRVDSPRSEVLRERSESAQRAARQVNETASESSHSLERPEDRNDRNDPTLVAMAGANARHFVPEKLPWQVLKAVLKAKDMKKSHENH